MNTLYNISLILLFIGIILMTIYITKSYNKLHVIKEDNKYINNIYNERPSVKFKDMFNDKSLYIKKYTEFDNLDENKLYL
jgi:hypothetical protein